MQEIFIKNEKELVDFGKKIATTLQGGDILCLYGDLGAGKTTLTKGVAQVFGIKQRIKSPTFTLFNVYFIQLNGKSLKFVHIDAYRLKDEDELLDIGIDDYLGNTETICVIEWAEKIPNLLKKKKCVEIRIEHAPTGRKIQY
ncbi:MAG TPA: tRNA (adenosine(37)-N6)-threonylcarbamoyltransferase complex ATPase subunit type 1 TsaE [Candidatus Magasanikbacteria bacterium]|nr:tRNA (adenosine(37)-N6)-threonylcarbamoyltransferase complex ATPase subunit type 1 TsaE [Candidatus Magasanikbacteria bacterium]